MGLLAKIESNKKRGGLLAKAEAMLANLGIDEEKLEQQYEEQQEAPKRRYNANDGISFDAPYMDFAEGKETTIFELQGADEPSEEKKCDLFSSWAQEKKYKMGGVFVENYGYFVMSDMLGFHAKTAVTSVASSDFWNGTLENTSEWEIFTEEDMNIAPFYQLFSEEDRYNIKRLCVLPKNIMGQHAIVFFASSNERKGLSLPSPTDEDFLNVVKKSTSEFKSPYAKRDLIEKHLAEGFLRYTASCFILSVKIAIDNLVSQCETANSDIRQTIYDTIYNSISEEIKKRFAYPNCITKGIEGEIKIAIFSNGKIEEELLKMQLDPALKQILDEDAQGVILIASGSANTVEEAKNFLF